LLTSTAIRKIEETLSWLKTAHRSNTLPGKEHLTYLRNVTQSPTTSTPYSRTMSNKVTTDVAIDTRI
jgi:hypothetical protein